MSDRPRWLRGDLIALAVVVIAIAVTATHRNWQATSARWTGRVDAASGEIDSSRIPALPRPTGPRHGSPFNDSLTARAESLCVRQVESNVSFQIHEPVAAKVMDRYGVGDPETGAGDSLDFDGLARTPSGVIISWHCSSANLGAFPGSPMISHSEHR